MADVFYFVQRHMAKIGRVVLRLCGSGSNDEEGGPRISQSIKSASLEGGCLEEVSDTNVGCRNRGHYIGMVTVFGTLGFSPHGATEDH